MDRETHPQSDDGLTEQYLAAGRSCPRDTPRVNPPDSFRLEDPVGAVPAKLRASTRRWLTRGARFQVLLAALLGQGLLVGCMSIDARVQKLTSKGQYEEALNELDKAGAGTVISLEPEPKPEALKAREIYRTAVEVDTAKDIKISLESGLARQAAENSTRGRGRCLWSDALAAMETECRGRVASIDAAHVQVRFSLTTEGTRTIRRNALLGVLPLERVLTDSPEVRATCEAARERLLSDALNSLSAERVATRESRDDLRTDLKCSRIAPNSADSALLAVESIDLIEAAVLMPVDLLTELARQTKNLQGVAKLLPVAVYCAGRVDAWTRERSRTAIGVDGSGLASSKCLYELRDALPSHARTGCEGLLIAALVAGAERLLVDPQCAPVAWVYLEAARKLSPERSDVKNGLRAAAASLEAADAYRATIAVDLSQKIEPLAHSLLFSALYVAIAERTRSGVEWTWVDPVHAKPQISIRLVEGELLQAHASDLSNKVSSYLSHHEDVPNPQKAFLESRLSSLKMSAELAESSYSREVSSHNIYPTEWSLIGVNSARTRYVIAVDQYNAAVREYNYTPDTISKPVFIPYTYREGMVRSGLVTTGEVRAGDRSNSAKHSDVASDNVRLGTKFNDTREASRRDDPLDVDVGGEAQLRRLTHVAHDWVTDLGIVVASMPLETRMKLEDGESALLGWLAGPFGPSTSVAEALKLPQWLREIGSKFEYPEFKVERSPIELVAPTKSIDAGTDVMSEALHASCEILTSSSSGSSTSRGSGALVSADGLILTCAHVLIGPKTVVRFSEGALRGEYGADVVAINDRADVALLRARGIRSDHWLEIDSNPIPRGMAVLAIGSPGVSETAVAHAAVTRGEIVTPLAEDWGQPRIVATIPIASGSSGGPMIAASTGRIVGIITAISAPQFSEDRASTGSFCLAAPASQLKAWLGLVAKTPNP